MRLDRIGAHEQAPAAPHLALGALLLTAPGTVGEPIAGRRLGRLERLMARLLGARHLAQGIVLARYRRPRVLEAAAVVDAVHCASMLGIAWGSCRSRRLAVTSAAAAALLGGSALRAASGMSATHARVASALPGPRAPAGPSRSGSA
jgi:hypothetical protein